MMSNKFFKTFFSSPYQHSLHNYNQRNQDSRNVGGKSKENRNNESNYGTNKSSSASAAAATATNKSSNEKGHDHSSASAVADKPEPDKTQNSKNMPILNEKLFASKCTIGTDASKVEANETSRAKDESSKESTSSSAKTSKNNSTDSEQPKQPDETGNSSMNKSTLNQTKSGSNYTASIQQSNTANQTTPPPNSSSSSNSKFTGTQVPNRVFVGGISTDVCIYIQYNYYSPNVYVVHQTFFSVLDDRK